MNYVLIMLDEHPIVTITIAWLLVGGIMLVIDKLKKK